jgi:hypothetical protein
MFVEISEKSLVCENIYIRSIIIESVFIDYMDTSSTNITSV